MNPDFLKQFEATNWKDSLDKPVEDVIMEAKQEDEHV